MDDASPRGPARHSNGRFGPGNPGRPRGARRRLSQRVALSLLRHFNENQTQILETLSLGHYLPIYMRVLGQILPRDLEGDALDLEELGAEDAASVARAVRAALERVEAGEGSLADIEAALAGPGEGEAP